MNQNFAPATSSSSGDMDSAKKRMTAEERYMARTGRKPGGGVAPKKKSKKSRDSHGLSNQNFSSDQEQSDGTGSRKSRRSNRDRSSSRKMIGGGGEISSVMPRGSSLKANVDKPMSAAAHVAAAAVMAAGDGQSQATSSTNPGPRRHVSQFDSQPLESTEDPRSFNRSSTWWGGAKLERRTATGQVMTASQDTKAFAAVVAEARGGPKVKNVDLEHGVGPIISLAKPFEDRRSTRSMSFQGHDREKKIMPDGTIVDPGVYGAYPVQNRASNNPLFLQAPVPVQNALRAARAVTDDQFLNRAFNELGRRTGEDAAFNMPIEIHAGFRRKVLLLFNFQIFYMLALSVILTQTPFAQFVGIYGLVAFLFIAFFLLCTLSYKRDSYPLNNILFILFSTALGICVSLMMNVAEDADKFSVKPPSKEFWETQVFRGMVQICVGTVLLTLLGNMRTYKYDEDGEQETVLVPLFTVSIIVTTIVGGLGVAGWLFIPEIKNNNHAVIFSFMHLFAIITIMVLAFQVERMAKQFNPDDYMKTIVFFWSDVLIATVMIGILFLGIFIMIVTCNTCSPGDDMTCLPLLGGGAGHGGNGWRRCCPCCPPDENDDDCERDPDFVPEEHTQTEGGAFGWTGQHAPVNWSQ